MQTTDIVIFIVSIVTCLLSMSLLIRDYRIHMDKYQKDQNDEQEKSIPKSIYFYGIVMSIVTVSISSMFIFVFSENDILFSLKRVVLLSVMWPVAYIDLKTYRIPNVFIIYGLISRGIILVLELLFNRTVILSVLKSEIIASVVVIVSALICTVIIKNSIGFGDIKLFLVMGLLQGIDGVWSSIFLSLIISFFTAIFLLLTKKKSRKDAIPFGPSLVIGTFISIALTGM